VQLKGKSLNNDENASIVSMAVLICVVACFLHGVTVEAIGTSKGTQQ
jgi:hypothetical protein